MSGPSTKTLNLERLLAVTGGQALDVNTGSLERYRLREPFQADAGSVAVVWRRENLEQATAAGLLVVDTGLDSAAAGRARILVDDARLALARLSSEFKPDSTAQAGIHVTATVHELAQVSPEASIGSGAVIETGVRIGPGSLIGAGSTVGARSVIGAGCIIHPGVHIYHDVTVGDRVILHSGAVLGADGFGFAGGPSGIVKIEHLGHVVLHDDVELGANSTVDRGTIGPTVIGARTKIDNLVQIGHNVRIGSDCLIAGQSAIGGSTVLGDRVTLAGNAALSDHIEIGNGATVGGLSGVSKNVPAGEIWFGTPAMPHRAFARRQYLIGRLEQIWEFVRQQVRGK